MLVQRFRKRYMGFFQMGTRLHLSPNLRKLYFKLTNNEINSVHENRAWREQHQLGDRFSLSSQGSWRHRRSKLPENQA